MLLKMQMHREAQLVVWPLLAHGAPVPVSQPQCWANTNRLSFIAVWQKHMRLEQNPPKTTTLSWGIIRAQTSEGKGRTLLHLSSNKNPFRRKTEGRDASLLSTLTGTGKTGCDEFLCLRWLVKHNATSFETCDAIGANNGCIYSCSQKRFSSFFLSIWRQTSV